VYFLTRLKETENELFSDIDGCGDYRLGDDQRNCRRRSGAPTDGRGVIPSMKFPRALRFDVSDANAFPLAAESGEWAVTGTFAFADADLAAFTNKEQLAFKNGWLGTESFGRVTFVEAVIITEEQFDEVVRRLASHLQDHYGAPDRESAIRAAQDEAKYTAELCDHPAGTLLAIEREIGDEGVTERIRVIPKQDDGAHAKIWSVVEDEE
jgi:hypothetical protein